MPGCCFAPSMPGVTICAGGCRLSTISIPRPTRRPFCRRFAPSLPDLRNYTFKILSDGAFCGLVGFVSTDSVNRKTEVGYWLLPPWRGRGIMSRCVAALCLWAFDVRAMNRVQIKCAVGNASSNAIPRRLGFRLEGVERAGEYAGDGRYYDLNVYSLLARERNSLSGL